MDDDSGNARPWFKRTNYFIDRRLQLSMALPLVAILVVVGAAYAAAIYWMPGAAGLETLNAQETRKLFLRANIIYYLFAASLLCLAAILLAHRIAGPAFVIERGVRAMLRGDFEERLSLRPGDYLAPLAASVVELRSQLCQTEERRLELLREVASRLESGDLMTARKLLVELGLPAGEAGPDGPAA